MFSLAVTMTTPVMLILTFLILYGRVSALTSFLAAHKIAMEMGALMAQDIGTEIYQ